MVDSGDVKHVKALTKAIQKSVAIALDDMTCPALLPLYCCFNQCAAREQASWLDTSACLHTVSLIMVCAHTMSSHFAQYQQKRYCLNLNIDTCRHARKFSLSLHADTHSLNMPTRTHVLSLFQINRCTRCIRICKLL
jgi:hypothetical protein